MSRADSKDLASGGSEHGKTQSLRGWNIPKLTAELRRRHIPFSATARKAKLFRLLFPPAAAVAPCTQQASLQSIASALTQLHAMVNTLTMSISNVQAKVGVLEVRPKLASLGMVTAPSQYSYLQV